MNRTLLASLSDMSAQLGAPLFGVAEAIQFSDRTGKRNPCYYVPDAKSVIVIGCPLNDPMQAVWQTKVKGCGPYSFINEILGNIGMQLVTTLVKQGKNAELTPYSGIFTKEAGALANVGVIGENNLLLTEDFGPRVRLRTIVTDTKLSKTANQHKSFCDGCPHYCWSACPANAFATGCFEGAACERYGYTHTEKVSENAYLYCRECEIACPVGRNGLGNA